MSNEFSEFVKELTSRGRYDLDARMDGLHASIGLCTEAAEVLNLYKKAILYNKPLLHADLIEEMGDSLYCLQMLCNELGITLTDLIETSMAKFKLRYPDGYSNDKAIKRDKAAERQVFIDFLRGHNE